MELKAEDILEMLIVASTMDSKLTIGSLSQYRAKEIAKRFLESIGRNIENVDVAQNASRIDEVFENFSIK